MTNLLVPIDFRPASLKLAAQAVNVLNRPVNLILFHSFEMPFYYQDFFRLERQPWEDLMTDKFRTSCKQLKGLYPTLINKISPLYMVGNSNALFRNLMEVHDINIIACPPDYEYRKIHERSQNPVPFFKKSRIALLQEFKTRHNMPQETGRQNIIFDYQVASKSGTPA